MVGHNKTKVVKSFKELRSFVKFLVNVQYERIPNTWTYVCCGNGYCYIVTLVKG